ncbi:MAG: redoxin family protein [Thiomonas sp.]|jgi:thiol-disulfide isomerase/thioredoxin
MNKINVWIFAAIIGLIAAVLGNAWLQRTREVAVNVDHHAVQAFFADHLADLQGQNVDIARFRGKPLIVNFWASWCPPCIAEMPDFSRFYTQNKDKGIQMIGIALDNPTAVREFLQAHPVSYPILLGGINGVALSASLGNKQGGLPFTIVLNAKGDVVFQHLGKTSFDELQDAVQR